MNRRAEELLKDLLVRNKITYEWCIDGGCIDPDLCLDVKIEDLPLFASVIEDINGDLLSGDQTWFMLSKNSIRFNMTKILNSSHIDMLEVFPYKDLIDLPCHDVSEVIGYCKKNSTNKEEIIELWCGKFNIDKELLIFDYSKQGGWMG